MITATRGDYTSDIVLGEEYRDTQTGIQGHATSVTFFQHGCERALIEVVTDGGGDLIQSYAFDTPRLVRVSTGVQAKTARTGGDAPVQRRPGPVPR